MIEIIKIKKHLEDEIYSFIWEFKVGDNISYNLNILYQLIDDYNNNNKNYRKPIFVIVASIIEALMIDFLYRLYSGTSHFPDSLKDSRDDIKKKLAQETKKIRVVDFFGKECEYKILKNFNLSSIIEIYEDCNLFGDNKKIYVFLSRLSKMRNRVHIKNYFDNFEKDENIAFSEKRTQEAVVVMLWVVQYFKNEYKRRWS